MKHLLFAILFGTCFNVADGQTVGEVKEMLNNYIFVQDTGSGYVKSPITITNVVGGWVPPQAGTLVHLISSNAGNGRVSFDCYNTLNTLGSILQGRRSKGTYLVPLPPDSGDVLIAIGGDGMGTSGFHNVSTGILALCAENTFSQISAPTYFSVRLTQSGSTTFTEKLRIRSTGQMLLNSGFYGAGLLRSDAYGNTVSSALTGSEVNTALGYTPLSSYTETDPQFDTKFSAKSTTGLTEGSNLYYTATRFNTAFSGKSTTDLTEGTNLYYTNARSRAALSAGTGISYNNSTGVITNTVVLPTRSFNNTPTPTIQTVAAAGNGDQLSSTRDAQVSYSVTIVSTATISGSQSGYIVLEVCSTNSSTAANWVEIGRVPNGQAVSLAIVLQSVSTGGGCISGVVPAGWFRRLRSVNSNGSPSYTLNSGQEILL